MRRWLLLLLLVTRSHAFAGHNGKRLARPTAIYSTRVYYRDRSEDEEQWTATATQPKKSGINVPMIRGICLGQLSTLLVATFLAMASGVDLDAMQWTDTATANSMFDGSLTTLRVGMGVAAAIPMILWSGLVEDSSKRDATHVNFATTNLVVSLFGRRHHDSSGPTTTTLEVIGLSTLLTLVTALSEEIVFRGYVPVALSTVIPSLPAVLLLQACFFGWSHVHPASKKGENQVVASLQTMNGLWHGAVYLMTGGDLLPCIISHFLYDMHVLVETWHLTNNQIDWAEDTHPLAPEDIEGIRQIKEESGGALTVETLSFCRRFFYAFDYERLGTLSLSDVQRAVSYAFLQDEAVPTEDDVRRMFNAILSRRTERGGDRLRLAEFLRLLFSLRSQMQARQQSSAILRHTR